MALGIDDFLEKHREYSIILKYPPFSLSNKVRGEYRDDLQKEEIRLRSDFENGESDAFDDMFASIDTKWADELEEARMYQKRYSDPKEAQAAGFKLHDIDPTDSDTPLEP